MGFLVGVHAVKQRRVAYWFDSQHIALLKCRGMNGKAAAVRAMLAARAQQACGVLGVWALCWTWLFPTMLGAGVSCGVVSALCAADTAASTIDSKSQSQAQSKQTSDASHTQ